jgi:acetyl-CoA carboxylase carboxyl transferase subunit beta
VIEQTIRQSLPDDFQTAEFLLARGLIDDVVPRAELRPVLTRLLAASERRPARPDDDGDVRTDPALRHPDLLPDREPWDTVQLARHIDRPTTLEYIGHIFDGFHELHGDHASGDCTAIVGGLARLDGRPVMVIGHQKGHSTRELVARNFGMPRPEGYRKAIRLMRLAGKIGVPVLTFIDTPGAYPGIEAEERGQAIAIAESLRVMSGLRVPVIAVVTGEGGSGGALALGVADRVLVCANAVYSVISPEGCAAILWNDPAAAPKAAAALRVSAADLLRLGVADAAVPEPPGGAHTDPTSAAELLREALAAALSELDTVDAGDLVGERRRRFRRFGQPIGAEPGGRT